MHVFALEHSASNVYLEVLFIFFLNVCRCVRKSE